MNSEITVDPLAPPSRINAALADLVDGLSKSWLWSAMALQDVKLRYRGSVLGPFWLTLSTLIMVAAMGGIYARLFGMEVAHYLPFLTIGLVTWQFIYSAINEGCYTFLSSQQIIQQACMPFTIYAWRIVYRNLLVLLAINAFWIAMLLGMISARYRDVPPIVANAVQVVFFVTPIFWPPESLGQWQSFLPINPVFAAIDVVRAPLLGSEPLAYSWTALLLATLFGSLGTFAAFVKFRPSIAYWV